MSANISAPESDGGAKARVAESHGRGNWLVGALIVIVVVVIVAWSLVFGRASIRSSNDMMAVAVRESCHSLAVSGGHLVEARAEAALRSIQAAAASPALASAIARGDVRGGAQLLGHVRDGALGLEPVAAYRADGRLFVSLPGGRLMAREASEERWFRAAVAARSAGFDGTIAGTGSGRAIAVFAPVTTRTGTVGYILASWRLEPLIQWNALGRQTGALYVVADDGTLVAESGTVDDNGLPAEAVDETLRLTQKRSDGHAFVLTHDWLHRVLVGYSRVRGTPWTVIATVPAEDALAPSRYLVRRITLLSLPGLVLLLLAAWVLTSYYYRQLRLAEELIEHNRLLRAADQAKSDFLANVSHDLRTPLAGLRVSISGLLDPSLVWTEEQVRESLQLAADQVEQLNSRVRNLLEMARIEANVHAFRSETCDLTDIVSAVLDRLRPLLRGRPIRTNFPAEPLFVECDQTQIETVVLNLVENAAKYSPPGGAITLAASARSTRVMLTVRDEGAGLRPGEIEHIFEKFYRGSTVGPIGGTGLGLAICRSIVEWHGGEIGARNVAGGGAEFWMALPRPIMDMAAQHSPEVGV